MADRISTEALEETPDPADLAPPGFDPALYLTLNPDVAAAGVDPARHYHDYGKAELRAILFEGQKLDHPESRLFSPEERDAWLDTLRKRVIATPLEEVIATHPRAGWFFTGFTLAGYLQNHGDVAQAVDDPLEAAFHFLEIGLEEGRSSVPQSWDPEFVNGRYGVSVAPKSATVRTVLAQLLAQGVSPLDVVLDEAQLWERAGLCGLELVRLFDHEYYHAICHRDAPEAGPSTHDRLDAIAHFLEHGIDAIRPINPDAAFDPAFYAPQLDGPTRETLLSHGQPGHTSLDPAIPELAARLYRHWLRQGLRQDKTPNAQLWGLRWCGVKFPQTLYEQMPVFSLLAGLDPESPDDVRLEHFVAEPRPAAAALDLSADDVADFMTALADQAWADDREGTAEWLYSVVLGQSRHHGRARRHLADLMHRKARPETATYLREGLSEYQGGGWNTLMRAEALLGQWQYLRASEALSDLPHRFLGDVAIANKKKELSRKIFHLIWDNLGPHVAAYGIETTQLQLRAALQACTPPFATADRTHPVRRVALIGNEDLAQCKLYRVDQKVDQLRAVGLDVRVISPSRDLADFTARVDEYDAAIFFRVPAFPPMIDAIAAAARHGLLTFYEIDDVVFDTEQFPPSLESYAGQIDAGQHAAMACGVPLFEHAMSL
ncbi:MAG: hypothetical protein PF480_05055, partial [Roseovarius sp.]|nr:hypothetical protein [Roseovarius sp.]